MQTLTARRPNLPVQVHRADKVPGTCMLFLSDYERFSEVFFSDRTAQRILQTISEEARAFEANRILFKECSAALFYNKPYLTWYAGVLGHVYSDSKNSSFPIPFSELNRSFALRILSAEPEPGNNGAHLTLLLPPLWHAPDSNSGSDGIESDIPYSRDAHPIGLCLLRPVGSGRWMGNVLQGEQEDGFRRVFSPEAVL